MRSQPLRWLTGLFFWLHALGRCSGMNKMLINHLDKIFVTSDTATLLKELEVAHPAAKVCAHRPQPSACCLDLDHATDMTCFSPYALALRSW
jgi:hypothetical protein